LTAQNLSELLNVNGLNVNGEYHTFNREERHYAALLFHFLLNRKWLRKFLDLINDKSKKFPGSIHHDFDPANIRIFFEYAHARDLWFAAKKESSLSSEKLNEKLRLVILSLLKDPPESLGLSKKSVHDFNDFFGAKSTDQIQMPGRWSKLKFSEWVDLGGRDFAKRACTLIWAFNAKADLVIHTGNNRAICIEAKVDSAESKYRAADFESSQTLIQEYILNELLGFKTTFVVLSKNGKVGIRSKLPDEKSIGLCWKDVFGLMDLTEIDPIEELPFVHESVMSNVIAKPKDK